MKEQILIQSGYEANFNGEDYSSVMFRNANLSVRNTRLPSAVETRRRVDYPPPSPKAAMQTIRREAHGQGAEGTWRCGDPGHAVRG